MNQLLDATSDVSVVRDTRIIFVTVGTPGKTRRFHGSHVSEELENLEKGVLRGLVEVEVNRRAYRYFLQRGAPGSSVQFKSLVEFECVKVEADYPNVNYVN